MQPWQQPQALPPGPTAQPWQGLSGTRQPWRHQRGPLRVNRHADHTNGNTDDHTRRYAIGHQDTHPAPDQANNSIPNHRHPAPDDSDLVVIVVVINNGEAAPLAVGQEDTDSGEGDLLKDILTASRSWHDQHPA